MTDTPDETPVQAPFLFSDWIKTHARGTLDMDCTAELMKLNQAVSALDKPGVLTVQIRVEPIGSGGRTVIVAGKALAKPPQPNPEGSVFYVGDGGSLCKDDPFNVAFPDMVTDPEPRRDYDPETGVLITDGDRTADDR